MRMLSSSLNESKGTPLISVVICTHNRVSHLVNALESIKRQLYPGNKFEVIVVDNASIDATRGVVESFAETAPVRYVYEKRLGLCHARNTGWRAARGRYIAYLDDDAVANPGWLQALEDAFAYSPDAGVVGGRVDPIWEGPRPAWLSDEVAMSLTIVDWANSPKKIADVNVEWLVGANMAVSRKVLEQTGGFHPSLDRMGNQMLSSGDVFLQKQIIKRGYSCLYYPSAAVFHLVSRSRLNQHWFLRRYYNQGLSDVMMQIIGEKPSRSKRLATALTKIWQLIRSPKKLKIIIRPTLNPERFTEKCFTFITIGHIVGLLGSLRH
jgi:glycosyltransferase involved in cell wall biosynthesis